jgi:SAM-dependent methyltransferase
VALRLFHPQGPSFRELARQALSSTRKGYDLLAPKFDVTPFRTPEALLRGVAPFLGEPRSARRGLDLCCGTGAALKYLGGVCADLAVGVDFSLGMLAEARRRLDGRPGHAPHLICGDVLELELQGGFDLVTWFGAWGHIRPRDQPRLVSQIAGALSPGGRFVTVARPWPPPWSPGLWFILGFDAAMWLRNRILPRRPFVMYYSIFMLGRARRLLEQGGLSVRVADPGLPGPLAPLRVLIATKRRSTQ